MLKARTSGADTVAGTDMGACPQGTSIVWGTKEWSQYGRRAELVSATGPQLESGR
jgi:hypothetical protein